MPKTNYSNFLWCLSIFQRDTFYSSLVLFSALFMLCSLYINDVTRFHRTIKYSVITLHVALLKPTHKKCKNAVYCFKCNQCISFCCIIVRSTKNEKKKQRGWHFFCVGRISLLTPSSLFVFVPQPWMIRSKGSQR